jgi:hypothetical protein
MFYEKMMEVKKHIALVFHKFIEKGIRIYYKGEKIEPFNPFLYFLGNVVELESEELDGGNVKVKSILLPHMSKIGSNYDRTGGAEGWLNDQGFYVYRGDRLLVWATWLGLGIKKKDHFKLVRIAINITNEKDFDWSLDIKKSKAQPPIYLRDKLKKIANYAIKESAKVYLHRAGGAVVLNPEKQQPLWREYKDNEDVVKYKINRDHPIIKLLKDNAVDETILVKALNLIEDNVPISLIVKNQNDNPILHEKNVDSPQPDERIIALARYVYEEKIKSLDPSLDKEMEVNRNEEIKEVVTKKNEVKNSSTLTLIAKEINGTKEKKNEIVKIKEKKQKEQKVEEDIVIEDPISFTDKLSVEEILRAKIEQQEKIKNDKRNKKKSPFDENYTPEMMQERIKQHEGVDVRKEAKVVTRDYKWTAMLILIIALIAEILIGVLLIFKVIKL